MNLTEQSVLNAVAKILADNMQPRPGEELDKRIMRMKNTMESAELIICTLTNLPINEETRPEINSEKDTKELKLNQA